MWLRGETNVKFWSGKPEGKGVDVDGRIILKRILKIIECEDEDWIEVA
jgi:hypothetical protein